MGEGVAFQIILGKICQVGQKVAWSLKVLFGQAGLQEGKEGKRRKIGVYSGRRFKIERGLRGQNLEKLKSGC